MNARKHSITNVLATGVIVVTLTSLGLFWARWLCRVSRGNLLPPSARKASADLSRLQPAATRKEPNETAPTRIEAPLSRGRPFREGLGFLQYMESRLPGRPSSPIYEWSRGVSNESYRYYDSSLGQLVYQGKEAIQKADGTHVPRYFTYYAGPDGMADAPDKKLGRFAAPIVDRFMYPQIVYDPAARRFFALNWSRHTVQKGPQLPEDGLHEPIQIRTLLRNLHSIPLIYGPVSPMDNGVSRSLSLSAYFRPENPVLILDASGRIDLLDPQTLHLVGVAGRMIAPTTFLGSGRQIKPQDVLAYEVSPISLPNPAGRVRTYGGCAVATLSREGLGMHLEVFDANGRSITSEETHILHYAEADDGRISKGWIPSVAAAYFQLPSAQILTVIKFALESLHPPVLLALSHWAAPYLEATAGYRSIFLLPDSFVAMSARDAEIGRLARFFRACLLVFPAILLALQLAWFVARDGAKTGLSQNARMAWIVGAVLFGLPAYLTYRLMRPKATLVTCTNCGKSRQPDRDQCHHCGSPWTVPELTPPAWRVLGEPEQDQDCSPAPAPQANFEAR